MVVVILFTVQSPDNIP